MKQFLVGILLSLSFNISYADNTIRIGIIDTGLSLEHSTNKLPICPSLSKSFVKGKEWHEDDSSLHGTMVANIIYESTEASKNYCFVIYKVFDKTVKETNFAYNIIRALNSSITDKVNIINLSFNGTEPIFLERQSVISALNNKIIVVAASGNEGNLFKNNECGSYPACYDARIIIVGAHKENGDRESFSNAMPNMRNFFTARGSYCIKDLCKKGTSFAAPRVTGNIVKILNLKQGDI